MRRLLRALLWLIGGFLTLQVLLRALRKIHPFPMPFEAAVVLDNPLRQRWMPVGEMVDRLGLKPGMRVLEVGPGTGLFTVEVARRLGDTGSVTAVDIQPQMLIRTEARVREAGLTNVETVLSDASEMALAEASYDVAFLIGVLGEIPDKAGALASVNRVLRPGGRLSITEMLPDPDYSLKSTTIARCEDAGFEFDEEFGNLLAYTVNFHKPAP